MKFATMKAQLRATSVFFPNENTKVCPTQPEGPGNLVKLCRARNSAWLALKEFL